MYYLWILLINLQTCSCNHVACVTLVFESEFEKGGKEEVVYRDAPANN